ncbi:MAG: type II toxin-antitoxin system PemK/MazF family toxin [Albidovulum sp.]|nr:type II toxin-antitoxin system PemK/MazF family toxin [Albidovulum sp.]
MKSASTKTPGTRNIRIKSAPKIRQVFWCNYPELEHTEIPEFYKRRPVVVISRKSTLYGVATIVPITGKPQKDSQNSLRIRSPINGRDAWIVCNHVHTVSTRRLDVPAGGIPRIPDDVFQEILKKVYRNLPLPRLGEID